MESCQPRRRPRLPGRPRGPSERLLRQSNALFGYEGESYSHGGYIDRGFNDIDWL